MKVFKTPGQLVDAKPETTNQIPEFNKDALVRYLKNYGSGFDDDAYEQWATQKGKQLTKTPLNPEFVGTPYHKQWYGEGHDYTYAPQYLEDEDWLREVWNNAYQDALDYNELYAPRDADDERSWGPAYEDEELDEEYNYKLKR